VNKFSISRTRFYPGFSEANKIRMVSVNTLTPDNASESNGCKIDRMLSSGGLAIRLTVGSSLGPTKVRGTHIFNAKMNPQNNAVLQCLSLF